MTDKSQLPSKINDAFQYSPYVLLEKGIVGHELEIAAYEYKGELYFSTPGEIIIPQDIFYDFDEKYSESVRNFVYE